MTIDYDKDQLAYALANALKERDEAREKAERYRLEANAMMLQRDEAREAFVIATDQMVLAQSKLRETDKERDEAREALMKIEDLFIDGIDIYADRENMGLIARAALEETK